MKRIIKAFTVAVNNEWKLLTPHTAITRAAPNPLDKYCFLLGSVCVLTKYPKGMDNARSVA